MVAYAQSGLNRLSVLGGKLRKSAETVNATTIGQQQRQVAAYYDLLRSYYNAEVYERSDANVAAIKAWEGLPRYIRPIVLVPRRAVEWWPGHLFPGAWTPDGLSASNGRPNMIQYDRDTPEELRLAVQQGVSWGGGPRFLRHLGRTGPKLGNAFAEVNVDVELRQVYPELIDPEYVVSIDQRPSGVVMRYRLAVPRWDADAQRSFLWGKEVDAGSITTYYDDEPYGFNGQPATIANPWGFVPAVFPAHVATGGPHGAAAIDGTLPLLDELNGVVSQIDDYIMRIVNQAVIVESPNPGQLQQLLTKDAAATRTPTAERADYHAGRQALNVLPSPPGTNVHHLLEDIGLAASDPHIMRLEREIEKVFPEIVLSDKLLEMDQVTRPGAVPLVQDVQHKFDESAGNYYDAIVRLGQMLCAIGGALARSGAWGPLTDAQKKFLPFDLGSLDRGDLEFGLVPAELIPKSFGELADEAIKLEQVSTPTGLAHMGYSADDIYGDGLAPEVAPGILAERGSPAQQPPAQPGQQPTDQPGLAADPNSALAFFERHVPPGMRAATGGA